MGIFLLTIVSGMMLYINTVITFKRIKEEKDINPNMLFGVLLTGSLIYGLLSLCAR